MIFATRTPPGRARAVAGAGLTLAILLLAAPTRAGTPDASPTLDQILAKARAAIGPEGKLTGVMTLRISGNILDANGASTGTVTLMFKKPMCQRQEVRTGNTTVVRASNGVLAWAMLSETGGENRLRFYRSPEFEEFNYSGLENLYFYRGTKQILGAKAVLDGPADYQNAKCWKVAFNYPQSIAFVRYFDQATGELRGTQVPGGLDIREAGKMTVDGITFPSDVQNFDKDGKLLQSLKISKIEINKPMDSELFDMPSLVELFAKEKKTVVESAPAAPGGVRSGQGRRGAAPQVSPAQPFELPALHALPGNTTPPADR